MTSIINANIFFFISSVGFIILGILAIILMIKILQITTVFSRIIKRAEHDIDSLGDITREMLEEMHNSLLFRFLFKGPSKKAKRDRQD